MILEVTNNMRRPIFRFSLASNADKAAKKAFSDSLDLVKKSGGTVVRDWTTEGEVDAYIWIPQTNSKREVVNYRITSALNRAFSGSYRS